MDFLAATDRVADCVTQREVAAALGVSPQSVRVARLNPSSPNYRKPPAGWKKALARLIREWSRELLDVAGALDPDGR
ncbi:MAG: hypothetical protein GEU90_19350 [Gemmatimonas sp.]|nr:hypothetical protein [Gemmatimonas sp.]